MYVTFVPCRTATFTKWRVAGGGFILSYNFETMKMFRGTYRLELWGIYCSNTSSLNLPDSPTGFKVIEPKCTPYWQQSRIIHLLNDSHLGVVTSAISLIHALSEQQPEKYKQAVGFAANRLSRIVTSTYQGDYTINDNQKFNPNSIKGFTTI